MDDLLRRAATSARIAKSIACTDERRAEVLVSFASTWAAVGKGLMTSPQSTVRELASNVVWMFRMLKDPSFALPLRTTAAVVLALAYFVCPIDVVPDGLAGVGWLDDAAFVAEVALLIAADLARYRTHAERRTRGREEVTPSSCSRHRSVTAVP